MKEFEGIDCTQLTNIERQKIMYKLFEGKQHIIVYATDVEPRECQCCFQVNAGIDCDLDPGKSGLVPQEEHAVKTAQLKALIRGVLSALAVTVADATGKQDFNGAGMFLVEVLEEAIIDLRCDNYAKTTSHER